MRPIDVAVTNVPDVDITADIFYDGLGYPCRVDWDVKGLKVRVDQRTEYKGRRHLVLALLAQGATEVVWTDNFKNKFHKFTLNNVGELL